MRRRVIAAVLATVLGAALVTACTRDSSRPQAEGAGGLIGGMTGPGPSSQAGPVALQSDRPRGGHAVVAAAGEQARYNYAPSLMRDGGAGRVRMWWCSQLVSAQPPGDDVLYAESGSVDGPFGAPNGTSGMAVFGGGGVGFDARHTCDPSVIRVGGTYYLYYTGAPSDHGAGNAIGLAVSADGLTWARANGGAPIVTPANEVARANPYGAGQPSALFLDGWFYLLFTDTTGMGAGDNGAGQFVLRSRDPAFARDVETVSAGGFTPLPAGGAPPGGVSGRQRSVIDAFSADWMWVDALNAFAIGHETTGGTTITFWDRDFRLNPYQPVLVAGPWQEGPGLVRDPLGHAPISAEDPCGRVPVDLVRATRDVRQPTDLIHFGLDARTVDGCATGASAAATLRGFAVESPARTVDVVVGSAVVRVERRSVAEAAGFRVIAGRPRGVDELPVAAHVAPGARAITAPDRGTAFLLDGDRLWPVPSAGVAAANSSTVDDVSPSTWDSYARAAEFTASR